MRFEAAQARIVETALEAAVLSLALLDLEHALEPGFGEDVLGVGQQAVEVEPSQALLERVK